MTNFTKKIKGSSEAFGSGTIGINVDTGSGHLPTFLSLPMLSAVTATPSYDAKMALEYNSISTIHSSVAIDSCGVAAFPSLEIGRSFMKERGALLSGEVLDHSYSEGQAVHGQNKFKVLLNFVEDLSRNMEPVSPEISRLIDENFEDLI